MEPFSEPLQLCSNGGIHKLVLLCAPFRYRGEKQPFLGDSISSGVGTQHRAHESCPGGAHFSLLTAEASPRRDRCLIPVTASHSKHSCIPGRRQSCASCKVSFLLGSPQAEDELLFPSPFLLERQKGEMRDGSAQPFGSLGLFTGPCRVMAHHVPCELSTTAADTLGRLA